MAPHGPPRIPPPPSPAWVIDLNNLPTSRPKPSPSIPDPPGFSHGPGGKVGFSSPLLIPPPLSQPASQLIIPPPSPQKSGSKPHVAPTPVETDDLFLKKAWELAIAPAKTIPMNAIMMYMSGNTLQIFSIMMTAMLFMNPLKALSTVGSSFARFDNDRTHTRLWPVKLAYIGLQIATIALGIWKVNGMGLLPYVVLWCGLGGLLLSISLLTPPCRTTRSDWLAWEFERQPLEYSASAFQ